MVKYDNCGYVIALIGTNTFIPVDSNGEFDFANVPTDANDIINLYVQDADLTIEEEGEQLTSINDFISLNNKGRRTFPFTLFPLSNIDDNEYYYKLIDLIFNRKYKFIYTNNALADSLGYNRFPFKIGRGTNKVLKVIITDFSKELDKERASRMITFVAKAVAL